MDCFHANWYHRFEVISSLFSPWVSYLATLTMTQAGPAVTTQICRNIWRPCCQANLRTTKPAWMPQLQRWVKSPSSKLKSEDHRLGSTQTYMPRSAMLCHLGGLCCPLANNLKSRRTPQVQRGKHRKEESKMKMLRASRSRRETSPSFSCLYWFQREVATSPRTTPSRPALLPALRCLGQGTKPYSLSQWRPNLQPQETPTSPRIFSPSLPSLSSLPLLQTTQWCRS